MITIEVNNKKVQAEPGEMLLATLRRAGIKVPTLCNIDGLPPSGACRMCDVEVEGRPNLQPSCATPVVEGMKVHTHSARAVRARKTIVELLLANHPDDCLYCVRNHNCQLQDLAAELGVRDRRYQGARGKANVDLSSPSIVRDPEKCILCGKCVRVCEEVQAVSAIDFVGRGSKTRVGTALRAGAQHLELHQLRAVHHDLPDRGAPRAEQHQGSDRSAEGPEHVRGRAAHAPAVSVSLAEEFGVKPGTDICGAMVAALRQLGFKRVFDTSFTADLTIMEEGSELVQRITKGGKLPMLTSCSPGWIKFVEQTYPDFIENVSTCKSPQQMMGAVIKSFFAEREGIDPKKIFSVSIMPCTAKKFEARRPEMGHDEVADVDAVLTTRELARMIRMRGIDLESMASRTGGYALWRAEHGRQAVRGGPAA